MCLTEFDNRKLALTNIVKNHLEKRDIDVDNTFFNFEESIKNLSDNYNRIHRMIDNYKPKIETKYENKERVVSILNAVENSILDLYLNRETISKLSKIMNLKD